MGYRLHPGQPIQDEVSRIAERQLEQAIAGLRTVGDPESDDSVHTARLVRPLLRRESIADEQAVLDHALETAAALLQPERGTSWRPAA